MESTESYIKNEGYIWAVYTIFLEIKKTESFRLDLFGIYFCIYCMYYIFLFSVNIIPNAMKNAAAMRSAVSGPVFVFVT